MNTASGYCGYSPMFFHSIGVGFHRAGTMVDVLPKLETIARSRQINYFAWGGLL